MNNTTLVRAIRHAILFSLPLFLIFSVIGCSKQNSKMGTHDNNQTPIAYPSYLSSITTKAKNGGPGWQSISPVSPVDLNLLDICGSPNDVFVVGSYYNTETCLIEGILLHDDGIEWNPWTLMYVGTVDCLINIWGSSGTDLFATGIKYTNQSGIDEGVILHFDGSTWTTMYTALETVLYSMWGSSDNDIFAVGYIKTNDSINAAILHYDGYTWTTMYVDPEVEYFTDVWGSSSNDVFVVGGSKKILHYDGSIWSTMDIDTKIDTTYTLSGVWGSSSNDVYAVGNGCCFSPAQGIMGCGGIILHYNGTEWTTMYVDPEAGYFLDIWGSSANDVFAVGENGTICHYNGSSWKTMNRWLASVNLNRIWGSSDSNVYAVGNYGTFMHYGGSSVTADFVSNVTSSGTVPLTVNFADYSTGNITGWFWDYGDGGQSDNNRNPSHTYTSAGTYTVSLRVIGPGGDDTITKTNYITVFNPAPTKPIISSSAATLSASCTQGSNASNRSIEVWNSGVDTLNYTITTNQPWISCGQSTGSSTGASDKKTHTFNFSTSSLNPGSYPAVITISAPGASNSPRTIKVNLKVTGASGSGSINDDLSVEEYNLDLSVLNGHGAVSVNPSPGPYAKGAVVNLTAQPDTGYQLKSWSGTDNDSLKDLTNTITMNASHSVTAEFEPTTKAEDEKDGGGSGCFMTSSGVEKQGCSAASFIILLVAVFLSMAYSSRERIKY